jgi:ribosome-binding factor A
MGAGYVGILTVELHFPEAGSLKGKRKFVKSAKAQLQNRFGAAVAEVDHHELWQRSRLTVACVAREHREAEQLLEEAVRYLNGQEYELVRVEQEAAVREVLAEAVGELRDPRIGFVTVTGVKTSRDLRHAQVFVSVFGSEGKRETTLAGLKAAHGVLQARIAQELRLKRTPQLTFEYDPTVERGVRMSHLIDELAPDDE